MKIFCDLDGTLIDVSARHHRVYSEIVAEFGGMPLSKEEYWQLKRQKVKWDKLLPMSGLDVKIESVFLESFIQKIEDPQYLKIDTLFPDSLDALSLFSNASQCYLVSLRRNRANLLQELERLNITKYFIDILTGHSENDGYDVKIALIKDKLQKDKGMIIGDTEADIVTGKELGLKTIALKSGIRDEVFLKSLQPNYLLEDIGEAKELIARQ